MNQDVVIVGAPRSGTNMLRDVLTSLEGVATWPCDEINLLWRHGNRRVPSDELTPSMARPTVTSYVRARFDDIRRRQAAPVVVEKTCATSLRVAFVREVLPRAKFVLITRDGVDAAASAMDRWLGGFDLRYTAAKARYVPLTDVPYYGLRFVHAHVRRRRSTPSGEVRTWWGPRPADYARLMREHPLEEICAIQWQRCVEASRRDLDGLDGHQVAHVSYERLVADPLTEMTRIAEFVGVPTAGLPTSVSRVTGSSVGKGRARLGPQTVRRLESLTAPTLEALGYGS